MKYNYAVFYLTMLLLIGCAGMPSPETNNERLALMEISYGTLLDKATLYADEGRLTPDQGEELSDTFKNIEASMVVATAALDAADQIEFDNNAANVTLALQSVRTLLAGITDE